MTKDNGQTICDLIHDTDICQQKLRKSTEALENPNKLQ